MPSQAQILKTVATLTAVAIMVLGFSATAVAGEAEGSASITILESLAVSEETPMDFGYVHRPSQGSNTLELNPEDGTVETNGSGDAQAVDGTSTSGVFAIQGAPEQAIQMSVSVVDFEDPSISFDEAFIDGPSDVASTFLDEEGQHSAHVGGLVTIDADAQKGTHITDVHVTVEYE